MKALITTIAALATVATFSATPAMAESTVNQQQYKLQNILAAQRAKQGNTYNAAGFSQQITHSKAPQTKRVISTRMLFGPEKAKARLSRVQPDAALGGR